MHPGQKLFELVPSGYFIPTFYMISDSVGADYYAVTDITSIDDGRRAGVRNVKLDFIQINKIISSILE